MEEEFGSYPTINGVVFDTRCCVTNIFGTFDSQLRRRKKNCLSNRVHLKNGPTHDGIQILMQNCEKY